MFLEYLRIELDDIFTTYGGTKMNRGIPLPGCDMPDKTSDDGDDDGCDKSQEILEKQDPMEFS